MIRCKHASSGTSYCIWYLVSCNIRCLCSQAGKARLSYYYPFIRKLFKNKSQNLLPQTPQHLRPQWVMNRQAQQSTSCRRGGAYLFIFVPGIDCMYFRNLTCPRIKAHQSTVGSLGIRRIRCCLCWCWRGNRLCGVTRTTTAVYKTLSRGSRPVVGPLMHGARSTAVHYQLIWNTSTVRFRCVRGREMVWQSKRVHRAEGGGGGVMETRHREHVDGRNPFFNLTISAWCCYLVSVVASTSHHWTGWS